MAMRHCALQHIARLLRRTFDHVPSAAKSGPVAGFPVLYASTLPSDKRRTSQYAPPISSKGPASADPKLASNTETVDLQMEDLLVRLRSKYSDGKLYQETENERLRHSLHQLPQYKETFDAASSHVGIRPDSLLRSREMMYASENLPDLNDVIELLAHFSKYLSLARRQLVEDPPFLDFVNLLANQVKSSNKISFAQIHSLLQSYQRFRFDQLLHDFVPAHVLRTTIDVKCLELLPEFTRTQAFILSDLWYLSSCSRLAEFPQYFISKIKPQVTSFKSHELVRLLLAISLQRFADPGLMLLIERILLTHVQTFTANEIAVVCAGFFKTQTTPGAELVDKVISRILSLDEDVLQNDSGLTSCAKFLNRYAVPAHHEQLKILLQKIRPHLSHLGATASAHVAALQQVVHHVDRDLLLRVCQKIMEMLPDVRMKDLAKVCETCATFNFCPEINGRDFFVSVVEYLEKNLGLEEVSLYPSRFVVLLLALAQMDVFSPKLLNIICAPAFLRTYKGQPRSVQTDQELLRLYYAVEIDFPERERPILPASYIASLLIDQKSREGPIHTSITSLLTGLQTLLHEVDDDSGQKSVALFSPLPYADHMLLVRLNGLESLPIPINLLSANDSHKIERPPADRTCYVICYHPWWNYFTPTHDLTGDVQMKLRHLRQLGYQIVNVDQQEMQNFNFVQKMKFLRDKLFFDEFGTSATVPKDDVLDEKMVKQSAVA